MDSVFLLQLSDSVKKGCDFFDNFLVSKYNNQYLSRTKLKGKYGGGRLFKRFTHFKYVND